MKNKLHTLLLAYLSAAVVFSACASISGKPDAAAVLTAAYTPDTNTVATQTSNIEPGSTDTETDTQTEIITYAEAETVNETEPETVTTAKADDGNDHMTQPDSEPRAASQSELPADFIADQKINSEVYAWITIPDTAINFPILHDNDGDNAYYLKHDLYSQYTNNGSIFTESYNNTDFSDYMTVVYGHCMKSGAMFAPLLKYMDSDYFYDHQYITIYTDSSVRTYKIFAAYVWDTRHLLLSIDFTNSIVRSAYITYVKNIRSMNANIDKNIIVTKNDHILTLSTCTYTGKERYLVQAVLTEERSIA